jgi:hypothetical protein
MIDSKTLASELGFHADQFINAVLSFDKDQINVVPFNGSWTPAQVAQHIIKATNGLPDNKTAKANRRIDQQVQIVESVFLNFKEKYRSPDFIIPEPGPYDRDELIRNLIQIKNQNIDIALTKDLAMLCTDFELPVFGYMTRYEWLKFFICHTQRHTHQLQNISNSFSQAESKKA